jgi:predicted nucleic-acid-binding protein
VIGIDTNFLVRYLTWDDAVQAAMATKFIESLSVRSPGFVSVVTMVETTWVLDRAYGLTAGAIAAAIEHVLRVDALIVENEQQVFEAMIMLKEGTGSFADAIIGALGANAGCTHTVTFARKAARIPGFKVL